jgi:methyl-accepting chemotaxis protein PixJ
LLKSPEFCHVEVSYTMFTQDQSAQSGVAAKPKKFSKFSLQTKATLLAVALGTIPLALVGTGAYLATNATISQTVERGQKEQATAAIDKVNRFMFERFGDVQVVANLPVLRNPQFSSSTSRQEKQQILDQYSRTYGIYDSIAVFELNGNVVVQSSGEFLGNHADRDYFQEALKSDKPVLSQPQVDKQTGKMSIYAAAPVKDAVTNKTISIVRTRMPIEFVEALLKSYVTEEGADYHLYDASGRMFLAGNKEQIGKQVTDEFKGFTALSAGNPAQFVQAIDNGAPAMIGNAISQDLNGMPNVKWGVAIAQPVSVAYRDAIYLRNILLVGGLSAGVVVALIAAYLANRATKPIRTAAQAVEKLGEGNLDTRLAVQSQDEIGILSDNINQMAGQLQGYLNIQQRAAQRSQVFAEAISVVQREVEEKAALDRAVQEVRAALDADRVVVYRFKPNWSGYIAAESVLPGFPQALDDHIEDACIPQHLLDEYRRSRVVPTNDVFNAGFHPDHLELMHRLSIKSNLVTPIVKQGELYGLFVAHHCAAPHAWEENEVSSMLQFAGQLSTTLERLEVARLQTNAARRSQEFAAAAADLQQVRDIPSILQVAVDRARTILGADRAVVYRFKPDWSGYITTESVLPGFPKALDNHIEDSCIPKHLLDEYRRNRVVPTNDVLNAGFHPEHLQLMHRLAIKSNLVTPILKQGELYGLFVAHHCAAPHTWEQNEIDLMLQFAGQVSTSIDRVELADQQSRAAKRSQAFAAASAELQQSDEMQKILNSAVQEAREILESDRVVVYRFKSDWSGYIQAESVLSGFPKALNDKIEDSCIPEGLINGYRKGRTVPTDDVYNAGFHPEHLELMRRLAIKSNLVTPILWQGNLFGLFVAHHCAEMHKWEPSEVEAMSQFASRVSSALDQATLRGKQRRQSESAQALSQIVSNMRQSLKREDILDTVTKGLRVALKSDRVLTYFFEAGTYAKGIIQSEALYSGLGIRSLLGQEVEDGCSTEIEKRYITGQAKVMNDVKSAEISECHRKMLLGFDIRANVIAPIITGNKLVGLLCVHHCTDKREWQEEEISLVAQLAVQIGFALDQANLLQATEQARLSAQGINRIVTNARQSLDPLEIVNIVVKGSQPLIQAERVVGYFFEPGTYAKGKIIAESLANNKILALTGKEFEDGCTTDIVSRYQPGNLRVIEDIYAEPISDCHREMLEGCQIRASIVAPIIRNQELIGLLCAHQSTAARQWTTEEVDTFRQLALQLGYAIDQAYLLEYTETARLEARAEADERANQQQKEKEFLQKRALELLMEVDPVSKGDLTVRATVTPDEMGTIADSYNAIIRALRQIVNEVKDASSSVASTATDNEGAISSLSEESKLQAKSIAEVLTKIDLMMHSIEGVADRALQAEQNVQIAAETLKAGDQAMNRTVSGISAIRETVSETSKKVKRLGEASQKISKVVNLIGDFAAQTNLLALNAAIEASRAGEEGRGFAVVAEEVRSLAQQSAAATAEIEQLVEEIQVQTSEVSAAMEAGTEQVVTGTQLVEETRQKLSQINQVSQQINDLVREISAAAATQSETSEVVTSTMRQVAKTVNATSEQSEQVADSFGRLLKVAQDLQVSVSQFKVQ